MDISSKLFLKILHKAAGKQVKSHRKIHNRFAPNIQVFVRLISFGLKNYTKVRLKVQEMSFKSA